jgi:hypothetical protein
MFMLSLVPTLRPDGTGIARRQSRSWSDAGKSGNCDHLIQKRDHILRVDLCRRLRKVQQKGRIRHDNTLLVSRRHGR